MKQRHYTRREFMRDVTLMGGGAYMVAYTLSCKEKPAAPDAAAMVRPAVPGGLKTFTADEYRTVAAATARILPSESDGTGAAEAGCVDYIDCALAVSPIERQKQDFIAGLAAFRRQSQSSYGSAYEELKPELQDEMLKRFQFSRFSGEQKFFSELLILTMEGFLGDPRYGGNKDRVGWKLVGFGPPFPLSTAHTCSHG